MRRSHDALDLILERFVDVPPELVWRAWTEPEYLKRWFTPKPWTTTYVEMDLRPGGLFRTVMRSPEGEYHDNVGWVLEAVENERLVWTGALIPGYRPADGATEMPFSAIIDMEPAGAGGTYYRATAMHRDPEDAMKHHDMGFHAGWGAALDQLVEVIKQERLRPRRPTAARRAARGPYLAAARGA